MTGEDTQFKVRLPMELLALLKASAQANRRSVTGEIIHRLTESFRGKQ